MRVWGSPECAWVSTGGGREREDNWAWEPGGYLDSSPGSGLVPRPNLDDGGGQVGPRVVSGGSGFPEALDFSHILS